MIECEEAFKYSESPVWTASENPSLSFSAAMDSESLSHCFLQSLSQKNEDRCLAEASLSSVATAAGFSTSVLRLAASLDVQEPVRIAAAVYLKNHLQSRWSPSPLSPATISFFEKREIKSIIVPLMLAATSNLVRRQMAESIAFIAVHDFPESWPSLPSALASALRSPAANYDSLAAVLAVVAEIFGKFRIFYAGEALRLNLELCNNALVAPILETFVKTSKLITTSFVGPCDDHLRLLLTCQRLFCEVFYSLNSVELPEFFQIHVAKVMAQFGAHLTAKYPEADGTVDALRIVICQNLRLCVQKNGDELGEHLSSLVLAVRTLLRTPTKCQLAIAALEFLTAVSTSKSHHHLFESFEVLQQVLESVVFPNIRLRDEDEELFRTNYVEYVRRGIEGDGTDTRRRAALELIEGIAFNYRDQLSALIPIWLEEMLSRYSANPNGNWKEKDCAIYLLVSECTNAAHLVDMDSFFTAAIVPELQSEDLDFAPMLKASVLTFVTVFRERIPRQSIIPLLPDIVKLLASESNAVHSCAAICLEKLLLVEDGKAYRYDSSDIGHLLPSLMTNLFGALSFPESQENPYVMSCMVRVLRVAHVERDTARYSFNHLISILKLRSKNPNFYPGLFDGISVLIDQWLEKDPWFVLEVEEHMFWIFRNILGDVEEYLPYFCMIFARLLLIISKRRLPGDHMHILKMLLSPDNWVKSVRLLKAACEKAPNIAPHFL